MTHPSPYDLIQKASRNPGAADRWAALQTNTRASFAPVTPPQETAAFAAQGAAEKTYPAAPHEPPSRPASRPELIDPPFRPPQPRHAALDDIALRHQQARKAASRSIEWKKTEKEQKISAPMQEEKPKP